MQNDVIADPVQSGMRWVLIETGSNQNYIFGSTKQRHQVAASAAIWELGYHWVEDACREVLRAYPGVEFSAEVDRIRELLSSAATNRNFVAHVVKASGKAYLLVPSREIGRKIINKLTSRAAGWSDSELKVEDTGIDVWGCLSEPLAHDFSDAGLRLAEANSKLEAQRYKRLPPVMSEVAIPFNQPCAYTGGPATTIQTQYGLEEAVSSKVSCWNNKVQKSRGRLEKELLSGLVKSEEDVVWTAEKLSKLRDGEPAEPRDEGPSERRNSPSWVGVIHADGNGVGKIFTNLRNIFVDEKGEFEGLDFIVAQARLSRALESLTWKAFRGAVKEVAPYAPKPSVLPLVVGGDDVIVKVSGAIALDFASALTRQFQLIADSEDPDAEVFQEMFERVNSLETAENSDNNLESLSDNSVSSVDDLARKNPQDARRLSMAAGLVLTKVKHPFHHSVELAESLTSLTKATTRGQSAMSVHVLYEPSLRSLDELREDASIPDNREGSSSGEFSSYCYLASPFVTVGDRFERVLDGKQQTVYAVGDLRKLIDICGDAQETTSQSVLQDIRDAIVEAPNTRSAKNYLRSVRARAVEVGGELPKELDEVFRLENPMFLTAMELEQVRYQETIGKNGGKS
ncbi:hypothetical protein N7326_03430 [Corynebacterium sp. ES2794-CONJ1]|uniref:hypothetical protein n=1 Tax=Corynebacterium sp. ES2794-CONJ1 TaxID=2980553 RepID=UPI0021DA5288|nr:hypothetical protein [Corynebacterium sp. ES2794-CONJ1]MCU9518928.1 hypothetical protein [Corynebacterium sp. ES2794-CONJ1]